MKKRSLEIDEDISFQHKEWIAQRIGVVVLSLFVLTALFGLTGISGPLSHGEAGNGVLHVEYDRVVRRGAKARMKLHLRAPSPGEVRFWVSAPYLEEVTVERVVPEVELQTVERDRHVYAVRAGSPDVAISLDIQHNTAGVIGGEIGIIDGPSVRFTQLSLF
jgi:hypothetical protein